MFLLLHASFPIARPKSQAGGLNQSKSEAARRKHLIRGDLIPRGAGCRRKAEFESEREAALSTINSNTPTVGARLTSPLTAIPKLNRQRLPAS